jgi:hypothetical protein
LLFDVIAGTSIGAMNGAILVSQYLETKSWDKASEELERFWTDQLSLKSLDIDELKKPWYDEWVKRNPTAASKEAARRYYSVKKLLLNQAQIICITFQSMLEMTGSLIQYGFILKIHPLALTMTGFCIVTSHYEKV